MLTALFLATPYVFWGLVSSFVLWTYYCVHDEDDFHWGASVLTALLLAGLAWRYDIVLATLTSWPDVAYALGAYLLAGVLLAGYKWMMVLVDFRPKAREYLNSLNQKDRDSLSETGVSQALYRSYYKVTKTTRVETQGIGIKADVPIYYPRWKGFPIANWLIFWPLFTFSVVLDPVWRATKRLVKWAGNALENLAKRFAVS